LRDGPALGGQAADHAFARHRPEPVRRPAAAKPGADRHRDRLCNDRALPGDDDRRARAHRQRPCRRQGAARMTALPWRQHLIIVPILLPWLTGALSVPISQKRHTLKFALGIASNALQWMVAVALLVLVDTGHWPDGVG